MIAMEKKRKLTQSEMSKYIDDTVGKWAEIRRRRNHLTLERYERQVWLDAWCREWEAQA